MQRAALQKRGFNCRTGYSQDGEQDYQHPDDEQKNVFYIDASPLLVLTLADKTQRTEDYALWFFAGKEVDEQRHKGYCS
jgi:hypothetical protein